jgi:hypothetical protein
VCFVVVALDFRYRKIYIYNFTSQGSLFLFPLLIVSIQTVTASNIHAATHNIYFLCIEVSELLYVNVLLNLIAG